MGFRIRLFFSDELIDPIDSIFDPIFSHKEEISFERKLLEGGRFVGGVVKEPETREALGVSDGFENSREPSWLVMGVTVAVKESEKTAFEVMMSLTAVSSEPVEVLLELSQFFSELFLFFLLLFETLAIAVTMLFASFDDDLC